MKQQVFQEFHKIVAAQPEIDKTDALIEAAITVGKRAANRDILKMLDERRADPFIFVSVKARIESSLQSVRKAANGN